MTFEQIWFAGWPIAAVVFMCIFVKVAILNELPADEKIKPEEFALMVFTTVMVGAFAIIWPVWVVLGLGYLAFKKAYNMYSKSFDAKQETQY